MDPEIMAKKMIAHIDLKRKAAGIDKAGSACSWIWKCAVPWTPPPAAKSIKSSWGAPGGAVPSDNFLYEKEGGSHCVEDHHFRRHSRAHKIVNKCAAKLDEAIQKYGENRRSVFPNTAYFLPIIYALMGTPVAKLKGCGAVMERCKSMLLRSRPKNTICPTWDRPGCRSGHPVRRRNLRAIRYVETPDFYEPGEEVYSKGAQKFWVGAANDIILRKRGVEFVDGSAPGFAAIVGSAPRSRKPWTW